MRIRTPVLGAAVASALACAGILGLREPGPRPFEHRAHVLAGVACTECHAGIERAESRGPLHLPGTDTCLRCHPKPHDERPCLGCHGQPFTGIELMQAKEHVRFSHREHLARMPGNCVRCHAGVSRGDERLRPFLGTCVSCHEHRDRFEVRDCDACHENLPRELRPPASHLVHGDDFLARHGPRAAAAPDLCASCHEERTCASCHGATAPALPSTLHFDDPFFAGMHRAGFSARHAEESRAEPGLCSTCHTEKSCRDCHDQRLVSAPAGETRRSPHPPGWVGVGAGQNQHGRAARSDPLACASCHGGAGEALCVGCHRVGGVGGNPHPPGWTSRKDLRQAPCRACHLGAR